jgi:hypothetical protein
LQYAVYNAILRHKCLSKVADDQEKARKEKEKKIKENKQQTADTAEDPQTAAEKQVSLARQFIGQPIDQRLEPAEQQDKALREPSSIYSTTQAHSLWAMYKSAEMMKLMLFDKLDADRNLSISRLELGRHILKLMKNGSLTAA